jgi:hypothetical protein
MRDKLENKLRRISPIMDPWGPPPNKFLPITRDLDIKVSEVLDEDFREHVHKPYWQVQNVLSTELRRKSGT